MKTPEELTATQVGSYGWGGATAGISSIRGSTWSAKIIEDAQPDLVVAKYFLQFEDLMGTNDVSLIIPRISDTDMIPSPGRTNNAEATSRTFTAFTGGSNITVNLTSADVKLGGCQISFETASATRISIIEMVHKQLVQQFVEELETACYNALRPLSGVTVAVEEDNSASGDVINTGEVVTPDNLINMRVALQENNYAKNPGEAVVFLHPKQLKPLLKSSQFTNASEFGGSSIVTTGVIANYVGCKIEVSTLVPAHTSGAETGFATNHTATAAYHYAYMIDPKWAAGVVWKEKARVKVVTEDDERMYNILLDSWYKTQLIQALAVSMGRFADA